MATKPKTKTNTIEGRCTLHPGAKLICPVCAGRKGGRSRKGQRASLALGLALFKQAKAMMIDSEASKRVTADHAQQP
jgi:hypothetical protein